MLSPSSFQPNGRPTIVTGVCPTITGSLSNAFVRARDHQFFALDIDLRSTWLPPSGVPDAPGIDVVRIRSIWVPSSVDGWAASRRMDRLTAFLNQSADSMGLRTIVLPRMAESGTGTQIGAVLRKRLDPAARSAVRFAIGIRGSRIQRGHDQLVQLTSLRHTAEEWDLDLALDLSGDVPHYLEAEAAVLRLLPRLSLVRIPTWVSRAGELSTDDPISRRVIAILADQGYAGAISIIPSPPLLPPVFAATAPTASDEWTRSMILDRYDRQRSDDRSLPYISPELFREHY